MTAAAALPEGKKLCPGWSSEYPKPNGQTVECGLQRNRYTRSEQSLIGERQNMCSRCAAAKKRWDDQNGQREEAAAKDLERHAALVDKYADDVRAAIPTVELLVDSLSFLTAVITAVDGLKERWFYEPFEQVNYGGGRVEGSMKMDVLRRLAGLELRRGR